MDNNTKQLLALIKENPDLEVIPLVSNELQVFQDGDDTVAEWGSSYVTEYCLCSDGKYGEILYTDRQDFVRDWKYDNRDWLDDKYPNDEDSVSHEANKEADRVFKKAIFVNIY